MISKNVIRSSGRDEERPQDEKLKKNAHSDGRGGEDASSKTDYNMNGQIEMENDD